MEREHIIEFCERVCEVFNSNYYIFNNGKQIYSKFDLPKGVKDAAKSLSQRMPAGAGLIAVKNISYVAVKEDADGNLYVFGPFYRQESSENETDANIFIEYASADGLNTNDGYPKVNVERLAELIDFVVNGHREAEKDARESAFSKSAIVDKTTSIREKTSEAPITESYEKKLLYIVSHGLTEELDKLEASRKQMGNFGSTFLRTYKNNLIVLNALLYRAAKSGGLDSATASSLNEYYARKIESSNTVEQLSELAIAQKYCEIVKEAKSVSVEDPTIRRVKKYVAYKLYGKIEAEDISEDLNVSKSYLSRKFKTCMNMSVPQYVNLMKIEEAKKLILFSDKTLSEISNLLSFSSQSYFQQIFKKIVGKTPNEFKKDGEREGIFF